MIDIVLTINNILKFLLSEPSIADIEMNMLIHILLTKGKPTSMNHITRKKDNTPIRIINVEMTEVVLNYLPYTNLLSKPTTYTLHSCQSKHN